MMQDTFPVNENKQKSDMKTNLNLIQIFLHLQVKYYIFSSDQKDEIENKKLNGNEKKIQPITTTQTCKSLKTQKMAAITANRNLGPRL